MLIYHPLSSESDKQRDSVGYWPGSLGMSTSPFFLSRTSGWWRLSVCSIASREVNVTGVSWRTNNIGGLSFVQHPTHVSYVIEALLLVRNYLVLVLQRRMEDAIEFYREFQHSQAHVLVCELSYCKFSKVCDLKLRSFFSEIFKLLKFLLFLSLSKTFYDFSSHFFLRICKNIIQLFYLLDALYIQIG